MATILLVMIDVVTLSLSFVLAIAVRLYMLPLFIPSLNLGLPHDFIWTIGWVIPVLIICLAFEGLYNKRLSFWQETRQVVKTISVAFLIIIASLYLGKISTEFSRSVMAVIYLMSVILVPLGRYVIKNLLSKSGLWMKPVLIMGAGSTGQLIAQGLLRDPYRGYYVVGFLDDDPAKRVKGVRVDNTTFDVIGSFENVVQIMRLTGVRDIVITIPKSGGMKVLELTNRLLPQAKSVTVIPDLVGLPIMDGEPECFFDERVMAFRTKNNLANPLNIAFKRTFDIVVGGIIFVMILPIMMVIALIIRLDSPGPAVFVQNRIGRKGTDFKCHKYRTMYLNNDEILTQHFEDNPEVKEEWDRFAKLRGNDPRVTRVGAVLRKFSLDELPQILDVITGKMSLIGPRPYLPRERDRMGQYGDIILLSNPGITGLWQVSGRNEIDFEGRLQLESWYVQNWSLWLDISILFRTIGVVLKREGAY